VSNGLTLCEPCHWKEHGYDVKAEGIQEIVDERGILNRRYVGQCANCGTTVVKTASDLRRVDGSFREKVCCGYSCSSNYYWRTNTPYIHDLTRQTMYETPKACAEAYGLTNTISVFRKLRGETQSGRLGDIREVSKDEYIAWARTNDGTLPYVQLPDQSARLTAEVAASGSRKP
jgi:hypothetical protein